MVPVPHFGHLRSTSIGEHVLIKNRTFNKVCYIFHMTVILLLGSSTVGKFIWPTFCLLPQLLVFYRATSPVNEPFGTGSLACLMMAPKHLQEILIHLSTSHSDSTHACPWDKLKLVSHWQRWTPQARHSSVQHTFLIPGRESQVNAIGVGCR